MSLRPTRGIGRLEFKEGGLLWRMPGRNAGGGSIALVCASESGTATLCGIEEYASPSTPPKKYRVQSLGGFWCDNDFSGGCGGALGNNDREVYGGQYTYNVDTCATSNGQTARYGSQVGGGGCSTAPLGAPTTPGLSFTPSFLPAGHYTLSTSQTLKQWDYDGICFSTGSDGRQVSGSVTSYLSVEDTEDDAIARATGTTPGTSCTAAKEPRGAGDFSFSFVLVAYDLNCTGLSRGTSYRATFRLTEETYGGGGATVTEETVDFVANRSTHTIAGVLDCPSGKQVTISNPTLRSI